MKTRKMRGDNGKQDKPDIRKLGVELEKLKRILEDRRTSGPARTQAIERMRRINRETDPARDVIW